jgi:uncharacterized protein YegP (UPF0339 family)
MKKVLLGFLATGLLLTLTPQPQVRADLLGFWNQWSNWFLKFLGIDVSKPGTIQIFKSPKNNQFYFRVVSANNKIVLASEGYLSVQGAKNGVRSLVRDAATIKFQILRAQNGQWYFVTKAPNYQVTGVSETYVSKQNAERGAQAVQRILQNKPRIVIVR